MRRRRRKYAGPKRPVRWIYSGMWENDNEETDCAVLIQTMACGLPVGVVDPPRADNGQFWHELVRGETDLDYSDKAAPCITRIVGDMTVRGGWNFVVDPPGATGFFDLQPYVRMGVTVVDEPEGTGWLPPDLWLDADGDGQRWLWRAQRTLEDPRSLVEKYRDYNNAVTFGIPNRATGGNAWEQHLDIRVNATVNKNQSLIMCHSYRFYYPGFLPLADVVEPLADVSISVLHDLRCLVKS